MSCKLQTYFALDTTLTVPIARMLTKVAIFPLIPTETHQGDYSISPWRLLPLCCMNIC